MGSFSIWHWIVLLVLLTLVLSPLLIGLIVMGLQRRVMIKHAPSGLVKSGYVGYCWTYFFLGFFVPITRGEIGIGVLHLILSMVTFGLFQLIMPFLYNKQYMTRMITGGWRLDDTDEISAIARRKLGLAS